MATVAIEITSTSPYSISYQVGEDGNAVDIVQRDVLADLVAKAVPVTAPIYVLLNNSGVAFAAQANAQTAVESACDLFTYYETGVIAGTAAFVPWCVPNIAGTAVGNFRLDLTGLKTANGDTATYHVRLSMRHSII